MRNLARILVLSVFFVSLVSCKETVEEFVGSSLPPSNSVPKNDEPAAVFEVLGQSNATTVQNYHSSTMYPGAVKIVGNKLAIVLSDQNRISLHNSIPTQNYSAADLVIGQKDLNTTGANSGGRSASTVSWPQGVDTDGTKIAIADTANNRVLLFNSWPTANGASANIVLGQPDFTSATANNGGVLASSLNGPERVLIVGSKLLVADTANNRILIWNTWPTSNGQAADLVVGQAAMTTNAANSPSQSASTMNKPRGMYFDGTKLYLADTDNHRVLIWNAMPAADGVAADFVLGQTAFNTAVANQGGIGAATLNKPNDVSGDGTNLYVADISNNRVLIWTSAIAGNKQASNYVLGQANFTANSGNNGVSGFGNNSAANNSLYYPKGVSVSGSNLVITDFYNHRVMIWSSAISANHQAANVVLGQSTFSRNGFWGDSGTESASTLQWPRSVSIHSGKIVVADSNNHRVLIWNSIPTSSGAPADVVLGQPDMSSDAYNAGLGSVNALGLKTPEAVSFDGTRLFIADSENNRVLIYNSLPTVNNQAPDLVLGQPDFISATANNGGRSAKSLYSPWGVYSTGDKLLVSDSYNRRVLIWNSIPTSNFQNSDVVIGQPDMVSGTTNNGGLTKGLNYPWGVYSDGTKVFVTDRYNQRIAIFNSIPTANHALIDVVLGQPDKLSAIANNGGLSAQSLYYPAGAVAIVNGKLIVSDSSNNRVLVWNSVPSADGVAADAVIGQANFTSAVDFPSTGKVIHTEFRSPMALAAGPDNSLYVPDSLNHRITIYKP